MALTLEQLVSKRTVTVSKLERIEEFIKHFKTKDPLDPIIARNEILKTIYSEFELVQSEIEVQNNQELKADTREKFETRYYGLHGKIHSILQTKAANKAPGVGSIQTSNVKLPEIPLPTFSGKYTEWLSYSDTFVDLIDKNKSLTDSMKFHYLRGSLKGEASKIIENLTISSPNYSAAWELLKTRYDNTRLIVHEHLNNILNAPSISKPSSSALRQLTDDLNVNLEALRLLSVPIAHWDIILIAIITPKLDFQSNKEWQSSLKCELPSLASFQEFLENRCRILESINSIGLKNPLSDKNTCKDSFKPPSKRFSTSHIIIPKAQSCSNCKQSHLIYHCPDFLSLSPKDRFKRAKSLALCINCLRRNHTANLCRSIKCKQCSKPHHTLLHLETEPRDSQTPATPVEVQPPENTPPITATTSDSTVNFHSYSQSTFDQVLLSTAVIFIRNMNNKFEKCRVLLDVGSQSNFITARLCKKLKLIPKNTSHTIIGINQTSSLINQYVTTVIKSRISSFETSLNCLVTDKITHDLPLISFKKSLLHVPSEIELADPEFNLKNEIDMLIGAQLFWDLLLADRIKLSKNQPVWQNTEFGWIVGGPLPTQSDRNSSLVLCTTVSIDNIDPIEKQINDFFEIELNEDNKTLNVEKDFCEAHFQSTMSRDHDGRFIVQLPFLYDPPRLGHSFNDAKKFLYRLEQKFRKLPHFKEKYVTFMREYLSLGHMEPLNDQRVIESKKSCFLPHHGVFKQSDDKSKIRVVFNASHKTSNGLSLNDNLINGPVVQDELFSILLRFRTYKYILTADITKFYRQIKMHCDHCNYQLILWRENSDVPIQCFKLNTLTYGTKPASFIASRCLKQLSLDFQTTHPKTSQILATDFYMDDLMTGSNSVEEAINIRKEISHILESAQLPICKWSSNYEGLIVDEIKNNNTFDNLEFDKSDYSKTLGLLWDRKRDLLKFYVDLDTSKTVTITKRLILSNISKIFDPLGLIGPVKTIAKILLQDLWSLRTNWDEIVPARIANQWIHFCESLQALDSLKIPRNIIPTCQIKSIELHGFADASMKAYGAVIYIRTESDDSICAHLLCSKSRVAPLKTISLPRLELCAARLLARLSSKVLNSLNVNITKKYFWTDSTIVLAWLSAPPNTWNIFVSNRVSEIQQLTNIEDWRHVPGNLNPADIISRGLTTKKLIDSTLWFAGPEFLITPNDQWPKLASVHHTDIPELKRVSLSAPKLEKELPVFSKFSSFNKLKRVIAYVYRFSMNTKNKNYKITDGLSVGELDNAVLVIIRNIQKFHFYDEIAQLRENKEISKNSTILSLDPFIDDQDILRVGGRLKHADIPYNSKYQILLPGCHQVTKLIITHEHIRNLHTGTLGTLAALRQRFWIPNGRNVVRKVIHTCYQCFRTRPPLMIQKMGNLPSSRTQPVRPFVKTGVDYAGPFQIKAGFGRQSKCLKSYIALFVCFTTKAVHLELTKDLTTESFLNAFRRFISRRGHVSDMYSDNGTNFLGAKNELDQIRNFLLSDAFKETIVDTLALNNINWHFIPPRTPHMGGLWEVNVRAVKRHLKTLITPDIHLNFDEMSTLLCRIEACLNSRPITPLSSEPTDNDFLTPGHFLIGESLTCPVEPNLSEVKLNRLDRWQLVERLRQQFWTRWSKEYLTSLQHRAKWRQSNSKVHEGMMVVLKDDNVAPQMWNLGRIIDLHPGTDGVTRVVTIKTARGSVRRSVHNIAPLPIDYSD